MLPGEPGLGPVHVMPGKTPKRCWHEAVKSVDGARVWTLSADEGDSVEVGEVTRAEDNVVKQGALVIADEIGPGHIEKPYLSAGPAGGIDGRGENKMTVSLGDSAARFEADNTARQLINLGEHRCTVHLWVSVKQCPSITMIA